MMTTNQWDLMPPETPKKILSNKIHWVEIEIPKLMFN